MKKHKKENSKTPTLEDLGLIILLIDEILNDSYVGSLKSRGRRLKICRLYLSEILSAQCDEGRQSNSGGNSGTVMSEKEAAELVERDLREEFGDEFVESLNSFEERCESHQRLMDRHMSDYLVRARADDLSWYTLGQGNESLARARRRRQQAADKAADVRIWDRHVRRSQTEPS